MIGEASIRLELMIPCTTTKVPGEGVGFWLSDLEPGSDGGGIEGNEEG